MSFYQNLFLFAIVKYPEMVNNNLNGQKESILWKPFFSCKCNQYGFCGNLCSLEDPCATQNPCANGICVEKCTDVVDYFCNCSEKYTGKNCTEEVSNTFILITRTIRNVRVNFLE